MPDDLAIAEVLGRFGLRMLSQPLAVPSGTLNRNYRVTTDAGDMFVRLHRSNVSRERIEDEHRVIEFAAAHEIPVVLPLRSHQDATTVVDTNGVWAVFPWSHGRAPERGALDDRQARALGRMLGKIHRAFSAHPRSRGAKFSMRWDKSQTLRMLETAQARALERGEAADICDALNIHISMLQNEAVLPPDAFASLSCQLTHGDFHDQQVLFDDASTIVAVTDWELFQVAARSWELVRCAAFSKVLYAPTLDAFLSGYAEMQRLTAEECALAVQLWWQSRVNGGWVWYAYLFEDNDRVAAFIPDIIPELEFLAKPRNREQLSERLISFCT